MYRHFESYPISRSRLSWGVPSLSMSVCLIIFEFGMLSTSTVSQKCRHCLVPFTCLRFRIVLSSAVGRSAWLTVVRWPDPGCLGLVRAQGPPGGRDLPRRARIFVGGEMARAVPGQQLGSQFSLAAPSSMIQLPLIHPPITAKLWAEHMSCATIMIRSAPSCDHLSWLHKFNAS